MARSKRPGKGEVSPTGRGHNMLMSYLDMAGFGNDISANPNYVSADRALDIASGAEDPVFPEGANLNDPFIANNWISRGAARRRNADIAQNRILGMQELGQQLQMERDMLPVKKQGEQNSSDIRIAEARQKGVEETKQAMYKTFGTMLGADLNDPVQLEKFNTQFRPLIEDAFKAHYEADTKKSNFDLEKAAQAQEALATTRRENINHALNTAKRAESKSAYELANVEKLNSAELKDALLAPEKTAALIAGEKYKFGMPGASPFNVATGQFEGDQVQKPMSPEERLFREKEAEQKQGNLSPSSSIFSPLSPLNGFGAAKSIIDALNSSKATPSAGQFQEQTPPDADASDPSVSPSGVPQLPSSTIRKASDPQYVIDKDGNIIDLNNPTKKFRQVP